MNANQTVADETGSDHVGHVQSFFDEPKNYLEKRRFDIRVRAETVRAFVNDKSLSSILDIGCGDGSISVPLLTPQRHLTLLDISASMLSFARSRVPAEMASNVAILNEDFLAAKLGKESLDLVLCMGVLAHVVSPRAVVEKIASLLKPGGTLVLECTDSFHFMGRMTRMRNAASGLLRPKTYSFNLLSSKGVLKMADECGFQSVGMFRYSLPPLFGMGRFISQDARYRIVRSIFGDVARTRNGWFANQYILHLVRRPLSSDTSSVTK